MTPVEALPPSQAPLYVRLKEALRESLTGMQPGDRFSSESEIEARYRVSRTTVRLALGALVDEGLIVRRQGKGNVVAMPKRSIPEFGLLTDPPSLRRQGSQVQVVNAEAMKLDAHRAGLLGIQRHETAYRIRVVHLLERTPVCYQVSYLTKRHVAELPSEADIVSGVFSDQLERNVIHAPAETVEIVLADTFRAELLSVPVSSPLLLVERVGLHGDGLPLELSRAFYPGHGVRLEMFIQPAVESIVAQR